MARPPARSTAGADAARAGLKMPRATWSARSGRQRDQWSGRLADDTEKKRDEEPKSVTHVSGINGAHVSGMDPGNIGGDGGIRTLDRALQPYNGLANRRLQPLGHVSDFEFIGNIGQPNAQFAHINQIGAVRPSAKVDRNFRSLARRGTIGRLILSLRSLARAKTMGRVRRAILMQSGRSQPNPL